MIPEAIEDAARKIKLERELQEVSDRNDEAAVKQFGVGRGFLRRWSDTQSLKVLDSWADKYQSEIDAMGKADKPADEIKVKIEEYAKELESKYKERLELDRERLSAKLTEAKEEWQRTHTLELPAMMKLDARYKAMTKEQLRQKYNEYTLTQDPERLETVQPYELDLLIAALESKNDEALAIDAAVLKSERERKHFEEPWVYSEKGRAVVHEGLLHIADPGTFNLRVEGKIVPFRYNELLAHPYEPR